MRITGALEGIRTPNLLIRSQMLYPLSYKRLWRWVKQTEYYLLVMPRPNSAIFRVKLPLNEAFQGLHRQRLQRH